MVIRVGELRLSVELLRFCRGPLIDAGIEVDQVRADLISKNKTISMGPDAPKAAKVEPRSNVPVSLVKRSYVDAVNAKPASFSGLPEFVLVLEPDDKGGVSALPIPAGANK